MQLKVGGYYITRNGAHVVEVIKIYNYGLASFRPRIYGEGCCYSNGKIKFNKREHEGDLVAEVSPGPIKLEDLM